MAGLILGVSIYILINQLWLENINTNSNRSVSIGYPLRIKEYYTKTSVDLMKGSRVLTSEPVLSARLPDSDVLNYITRENDLLAFFRFSSPLPKNLPAKLPDVKLEEVRDQNYIRVTDSTDWVTSNQSTDQTWTRVGQMLKNDAKQIWIESLYDSRNLRDCAKVPVFAYDSNRAEYIETNDGFFNGCVRFKLQGSQSAVYNPSVIFDLVAKKYDRFFLLTGEYSIIDNLLLTRGRDFVNDDEYKKAVKEPLPDTKKRYDDFVKALKNTKLEFIQK